MSIVLSTKAEKLMKLLDAEGFASIEELCRAALMDSVCPAICMTKGCDHVAEMEPDQREGHCESCGGNTLCSGLVLAGFI